MQGSGVPSGVWVAGGLGGGAGAGRCVRSLTCVWSVRAGALGLNTPPLLVRQRALASIAETPSAAGPFAHALSRPNRPRRPWRPLGPTGGARRVNYVIEFR